MEMWQQQIFEEHCPAWLQQILVVKSREDLELMQCLTSNLLHINSNKQKRHPVGRSPHSMPGKSIKHAHQPPKPASYSWLQENLKALSEDSCYQGRAGCDFFTFKLFWSDSMWENSTAIMQAVCRANPASQGRFAKVSALSALSMHWQRSEIRFLPRIVFTLYFSGKLRFSFRRGSQRSLRLLSTAHLKGTGNTFRKIIVLPDACGEEGQPSGRISNLDNPLPPSLIREGTSLDGSVQFMDGGVEGHASFTLAHTRSIFWQGWHATFSASLITRVFSV